jgi:hypothetical protein
MCVQAQSCRRHGAAAFVLRASQAMHDIPYGDYFRVDSRWDVRADGPTSCTLRVGVEVVFSKSTFLKSTIEGTTFSETSDAVKLWVAGMKQHVTPVMGNASEEESPSAAKAEAAALPAPAAPPRVEVAEPPPRASEGGGAGAYAGLWGAAARSASSQPLLVLLAVFLALILARLSGLLGSSHAPPAGSSFSPGAWPYPPPPPFQSPYPPFPQAYPPAYGSPPYGAAGELVESGPLFWERRAQAARDEAEVAERRAAFLRVEAQFAERRAAALRERREGTADSKA